MGTKRGLGSRLVVRRPQLVVLAVVLCGYGAWNLWLAVQTAVLSFWLMCALCLFAALGVLLNRRACTWLIYLAGLMIVGEWVLSLMFSWRTGYFSHTRLTALISTLAPGLGATCLAAYCCLIAWRYVGRR